MLGGITIPNLILVPKMNKIEAREVISFEPYFTIKAMMKS